MITTPSFGEANVRIPQENFVAEFIQVSGTCAFFPDCSLTMLSRYLDVAANALVVEDSLFIMKRLILRCCQSLLDGNETQQTKQQTGNEGRIVGYMPSKASADPESDRHGDVGSQKRVAGCDCWRQTRRTTRNATG